MRAPGHSLRVSGGDYVLGGLWLRPGQIDALSNHHAARLIAAVRAHDADAARHHAAWLRDLDRAVIARADHRRASAALGGLAGASPA